MLTRVGITDSNGVVQCLQCKTRLVIAVSRIGVDKRKLELEWSKERDGIAINSEPNGISSVSATGFAACEDLVDRYVAQRCDRPRQAE